MEQEDLAFHQRVHQGFCILADTFPNRIHRINVSRATPETVHAQIMSILKLK